jgi:hypothetical protein
MTSSSRTLNLANGNEQLVPDERTPLLKKESARFDDAVPCVAEIDAEAGRVLVDKSLPEEESKNISGVISILLIGVCRCFHSPTTRPSSARNPRTFCVKAATNQVLQEFSSQTQIHRLSSLQAEQSAASSMTSRTRDG